MEEKPRRIIFLDLLRAFAVLMMIQGHTVHTLLATEYRSNQYTLYSIWEFFRGFTAPIFMFTAGSVFAYLFLSNGLPWKENPRMKKGFIRFITLLTVGYILRYPTYTIIDFSQVTELQWYIFTSVDALHLIAFGLLFLILILWLAEKLHTKAHYLFLIFAVLFFTAFPFVRMVNWLEIFPLPIAAYFTKASGSLFPLFPWAGYVLSGGILGSYLVSHPKVYKQNNFMYLLFLFGSVFYALGLFINYLGYAINPEYVLFSTSWMIVLQRVGVVMVITSVMVFIAKRIKKNIPNVIKLVGRHTLLIYVVHLVILYGSAWIPGLNKFFRESFSPWATLGSVVLMYIFMVLLVLSLEKVKLLRKKYAVA